MTTIHYLRPEDGGMEAAHVHAAQSGTRVEEDLRCALCGASLAGEPISYRMVSPLVSMGSVTVCRACHKVALSEGYLPSDSEERYPAD